MDILKKKKKKEEEIKKKLLYVEMLDIQSHTHLRNIP
jgi:hypothetical protein